MSERHGADAPIELPYTEIRNLTSDEEKRSGVSTYFANVPAYEICRIGTADNLRDYIPGTDPETMRESKRNSTHKAIERTILDAPDRFINRNGGITVTCSSIVVDDKARVARLVNPSVINGAQTRGEILRAMRREQSLLEDGEAVDGSPFSVRVEIIADPDPTSVVETAIARNTASPVKSISQAGARGQLDELNLVMQKEAGLSIVKKENEASGDDLADTFLVLQLSRLLMPRELMPSDSESEILRPYKQKAAILDDFTKWHKGRLGSDDDAKRYRFTLDIAPTAFAQKARWENSHLWAGKRVRAETRRQDRPGRNNSFRRNSKGEIESIAPGILFPMVSALREFVIWDPGSVKWKMVEPPAFEENDLIDAVLAQWRGHDNDPYRLGRSIAAYEALRNITMFAARISARSV